MNVGWGPLSFSVSRGREGGTTNFIGTNIINKPLKLYIYKDIRVSRYKIMRRPTMASDQPWEFVEFFQTAVPTRNYLTIKILRN